MVSLRRGRARKRFPGAQAPKVVTGRNSMPQAGQSPWWERGRVKEAQLRARFHKPGSSSPPGWGALLPAEEPAARFVGVGPAIWAGPDPVRDRGAEAAPAPCVPAQAARVPAARAPAVHEFPELPRSLLVLQHR